MNLGGLRAVAISDTINGVGLLFRLLIPTLALKASEREASRRVGFC